MTNIHSFVSDIWFTNASTNIRITQGLFGTSCNSLSALTKSILNTNCWNNFRAISMGIFIAQFAYYTSGMLWIPTYWIYSQIYYYIFPLWNYFSTLFSRSRYLAVLFVPSAWCTVFMVYHSIPSPKCDMYMMTSSNGNIFRVTGHLCARGIHRSPVNSPHKGQWRGALIFLWSAPE